MAVQPHAGISTPQGNSKPAKKMSRSDGRVRGASPVGDGTANGPDCVDGVFSKTAQGLGHYGDEVRPY